MNTIEYKEEYGAVSLPEGFAEKLAGKTPEEQKAYYQIEKKTVISKYSYGDLDSRSVNKKLYALNEFEDCTALVIKDGIVVGVTVKTYNYSKKDVCCLATQTVETYSDSDDDGSGSTDCDDYVTLLCI